jgi:hypothetical protein
MTRFVRSLLATSLLAVVNCSESLSREDFYAVWGAEGVKLTLSVVQALFETPCWAGDMAIPIIVDSDRFTAIGTVYAQGGTGTPEARAVILEGRVDGDEMRLTVESSPAMGPYTLRRGVAPVIAGCP